MAVISKGRSKIEYEKIKEEDILSKFVEQLTGRPYDISSSPYRDLAVLPKDLLEMGPYAISDNANAGTWYNPSRTIRAQSKISPLQYRGLPPEYIDHIISDVKRKLVESISESIAQQVIFREDMSYDGTITIEANIDLDRFRF